MSDSAYRLILEVEVPDFYVDSSTQEAADEWCDGKLLPCGSWFGLGVRRHRLFEANFPLMSTPCGHSEQGEIRGYYGRN